MTAEEDRLRAALAMTADMVREDALRPLAVPHHRPRRWAPVPRRWPPRLRRWSLVLAPAAAAMAVVVIIGVEAAVGGLPAAARGAAGGPAAASPVGRSRTGPGGATASACAPAVNTARSGGPAGPQTRTAVRVASGSAGGEPWSLWAEKGVAGARGLEDGGLVRGGRWYGLCTGVLAMAQMELLDTGARGIVYGYIEHPGRFTVTLTARGSGAAVDTLPSPSVISVRGMTFFIGQLPRPACAYPVIGVQAAAKSYVAPEHRLFFSGSCRVGRLVAVTLNKGGPVMSLAPTPTPTPSAAHGPVTGPVHTWLCPLVPAGSESRPAAPMRGMSVPVASGSAGGLSWSVWAKKGVAGAPGVAAGGLVTGGRWYAMCASETDPGGYQLLDAGGHGFVFGFLAAPGRYALTFSPRRALAGLRTIRLRGGTFFIGRVNGPSCSLRSLGLRMGTRPVTHLHENFGACHPGQVAGILGASMRR